MAKWRYGVILDAGSSGTRVYVYKWLDAEHARRKAKNDPAKLQSLPELLTEKQWTLKTHPGVSAFVEKPQDIGNKHLGPLLEHAQKYVPKSSHRQTPIFLLATAGMRLIPEKQREQLLDEICTYTRVNTEFQLPDCDLHIQVIPGETEGLYGWISANYLIGGFDRPQEHDHGKSHHTYGFLDMGGASAQLAFVPNATETQKHANDLKLLRLRKANGLDEEYRVFTTTWLGFGAKQARQRYLDFLKNSTSPTATELPDPCLPTGIQVTAAGALINSRRAANYEPVAPEARLVGTGQFLECLRSTKPLLEMDKPCEDQPCLISGRHVPAIDFDVNHFVGVSEYWHTTHEIFEMGHKGKEYNFQVYQSRVIDFCTQDWSEILQAIKAGKWGRKVDETTALEVCFKASWLINMLHEGIGIPRMGIETSSTDGNSSTALNEAIVQQTYLNPFQAVNKIHGTEVSWTLGRMVLYASSQIPPSQNTLPVGFGSNPPSSGSILPPDFELAGPPPTSKTTPTPGVSQLPSASASDTATAFQDDSDWSNALLFYDSPRRIPGVLLFLVLLIIALYFACIRRRRPGAVSSGPRVPLRRAGRTSGSRLGKLLALAMPSFMDGSRPRYERLRRADEEIGMDSDGQDVELERREGAWGPGGAGVAVYAVEDSEDEEHGQASGWATPRAEDGPGPILSGLSSPGKRGGGLLGEGLLARTESRERLSGFGGRSMQPLTQTQRKSRPGSPAPWGRGKENVD